MLSEFLTSCFSKSLSHPEQETGNMKTEKENLEKGGINGLSQAEMIYFLTTETFLTNDISGTTCKTEAAESGLRRGQIFLPAHHPGDSHQAPELLAAF